MIDISEVVADSDFVEPITVYRVTGALSNEGEITKSEVAIARIAVVQPASKDDMVSYVPEGERTDEAIRIWCTQDLRMSDGNSIHSDIIEWSGKRYRVAYSAPWQQHGYYFVIAVATAT
jgi:hypothetical protein